MQNMKFELNLKANKLQLWNMINQERNSRYYKIVKYP